LRYFQRPAICVIFVDDGSMSNELVARLHRFKFISVNILVC